MRIDPQQFARAALAALALTVAFGCRVDRAPIDPAVREDGGTWIDEQRDPVLGGGGRGLNPSVIITPAGVDTAVCGNGQLEPGEVCDPELHACCLDDCSGAVAAGETCRAATGDCDVEERCDGTSFECPADAVAPPTEECRAAAGDCDVEEHCDGESKQCPPDALRPDTTVCRAASDACDAPETCTGESAECPEDAVAPADTVCRPAAAGMLCDAPELCDGSSKTCPDDAPAPAGTICRSPLGTCDRFAACDGTSMECPDWVESVAPAGTTCRPAADLCDAVETCDGVQTTCPPDGLRPAGAQCRAAADLCDVAETCTGSSAACPDDRFAASGTLCRGASDDCDVAERCTGESPACPANAFAPATTECRRAAGPCDVAEHCTGTAAACPANAFVAAGTECREADGVCDVPERCTGTSAACPSNAYVSAGTQCRAAMGVCDVAESCTGSGPDCPGDAVASENTVCREANPDEPCDAPEHCPGGTGKLCPDVDESLPNGASCNRGLGMCWSATCCPGITRDMGRGCELDSPRRIVFVTSIDESGALGGVDAADELCTDLAREAGLASTYSAWLSAAGTGPIGRVGSGPYHRVDGTLVASSTLEIARSGMLQAPIERTESNETRRVPVWTGTASTGVPGQLNCREWTGDADLQGTYGMSSQTSSAWTDSGIAACSEAYALYCFQDDCPNAPRVDFMNDPNNCGACGHRCTGQQPRCVRGICNSISTAPGQAAP